MGVFIFQYKAWDSHHFQNAHTERAEILNSREMENEAKGKVCVTGGTGFIGSWLIKMLLENGYSVTTTVRGDPRKNPLSPIPFFVHFLLS